MVFFFKLIKFQKNPSQRLVYMVDLLYDTVKKFIEPPVLQQK